MLERGTLWFLRNGGAPIDISANIAAFERPLAILAERLGEVVPEQIKQRIADQAAHWREQGAPAALASGSPISVFSRRAATSFASRRRAA